MGGKAKAVPNLEPGDDDDDRTGMWRLLWKVAEHCAGADCEPEAVLADAKLLKFAMDEDDFRTTVTVRGSVCKDLFAASEAWMIAHDAGAAMPSIAGEKLKERRYVRAVRLIRQNQLHTEPVLLSVLSTQEELDTAMHLQRLECAAFDELSSALFCTAWPIVQDRYRFRFHGHGYDLTWRCPLRPCLCLRGTAATRRMKRYLPLQRKYRSNMACKWHSPLPRSDRHCTVCTTH